MTAVATLIALVLAGPGPLPLPKAQDEVRFGIKAAERGLWGEARFRFERAIVLDPKNAKALNDLAVALEQQGDFAKARETYEKALKLKPEDQLIQQNYDLFREADDKRNRKTKGQGKAPGRTPPAAPAPAPAPPAAPSPAPPDKP